MFRKFAGGGSRKSDSKLFAVGSRALGALVASSLAIGIGAVSASAAGADLYPEWFDPTEFGGIYGDDFLDICPVTMGPTYDVSDIAVSPPEPVLGSFPLQLGKCGIYRINLVNNSASPVNVNMGIRTTDWVSPRVQYIDFNDYTEYDQRITLGAGASYSFGIWSGRRASNDCGGPNPGGVHYPAWALCQVIQGSSPYQYSLSHWTPAPPMGTLEITKYYTPDVYPMPEVVTSNGTEIDWGALAESAGITEPKAIAGVQYRIVLLGGLCFDEIPPADYVSDCNNYEPLYRGIGFESIYTSNLEALIDLANFYLDQLTPLQQNAAVEYWISQGFYATGITDENGIVGGTTNPWILSNGSSTVIDLPIGLAYIEEIATPPGVRLGLPFLATIPMPDGEGGWNYYIHAYPKNDVEPIKKDVIDPTNCPDLSNPSAPATLAAGADPLNCAVIYDKATQLSTPPNSKVGDEITYRVVVDIPRIVLPADRKDWDIDFGIADIFNSDNGEMVIDESSLQLTFAGEDGAYYAANYQNCEVLAPGCADDYHYMFLTDPEFITGYGTKLFQLFLVGSDAQYVFMEQRADEDAGSLQFVITYTAKVTAQGEYTNFVGMLFQDEDNVILSNDVTVAYGGVSLWKYAVNLAGGLIDRNDPGTGLPAGSALGRYATYPEDAEIVAFSVYPWHAITGCDLEAPAIPFWGVWDDRTDNIAADPDDEIHYGTGAGAHTSTEWEYAFNGLANIGGLAYGTYCINEIVAPKGFRPLGEPIIVEINKPLDGRYFVNNGALSGITGKPLDDDYLVPNYPANAGFPFPITGGASSLIYAVVAGVIVAGTLYVIQRQKKQVSA